MKRSILLVGLLMALVATPAFAEDEGGGAMIGGGDESLQVIVGPGGTALDALALPDARCMNGADTAACNMVTSVLRRDMVLSFMFQVIPPRAYIVDPDDEPIDSPAWSDWTSVGAHFLVKVRVSGAGPYAADFRMYNVTQKERVAVATSSFTDLTKGELRRAAHQFANAIVGARTGKPGVFHTRIAYSKKMSPGVKGVGIVDMDGHGKTLLIRNGSINMLPSWGFGGVLYTSFIGGRPELYFGKRKFSRDGGHYRSVAVSRDGSRVIASVSYGGQSDLYLLSKDGQMTKNLTNTGHDEVSPTISPDGSKVAFVSSAPGAPQIYVMSTSGGEATRLTFAGNYNYSPDWGSNGLIAFAAMTEEGSSDVFTVTETGDVRRLTQNQGNNKDPSWSPDGRYVAFVSQRSAGSGIYVMSADGRYQSLILKGGGYGNVAWEH